jgi:hypothetical protein
MGDACALTNWRYNTHAEKERWHGNTPHPEFDFHATFSFPIGVGLAVQNMLRWWRIFRKTPVCDELC